MQAPALDLTTSLRGDFGRLHQTLEGEQGGAGGLGGAPPPSSYGVRPF